MMVDGIVMLSHTDDISCSGVGESTTDVCQRGVLLRSHTEHDHHAQCFCGTVSVYAVRCVTKYL